MLEETNFSSSIKSLYNRVNTIIGEPVVRGKGQFWRWIFKDKGVVLVRLEFDWPGLKEV